MVEISYTAAMNVVISWDRLKTIKNYQTKLGELILARLFELDPSVKSVLGLDARADISQDAKYSTHAKQMVNMMDCAIALLGPDMDELQHDLARLGRRHAKYGVKARHLPVLETAVLHALEVLLGKLFTQNDRNCWQLFFYFMIMHMTEGMKCTSVMITI